MNVLITRSELPKWLKNVFMFTAPAVAAFFGQLALGVEIKEAWPFALVILWGLLADYFKKLK